MLEGNGLLTDSGWAQGTALESILPHRGMNLLIDAARTVREGGEVRGQSRLRVAPGDPSGRDIFLCWGDDGDGGAGVLPGPALIEHLALNAINVMKPEMGPDEIAFFSLVSGFESARETAPGEALTSEVVRKRDKGNFRRFDGVVRGADGSAVATAEIMAYAGPPVVADRRATSKLAAPPVVGKLRPVDKALFPWKPREMVFVDELVDIADDRAEATFRYAYPNDHAFCAGHFPGNPVMMGVTQWIAVADAAAFLALERVEAGEAPPGGDLWRADGEIVRESGALVAEVRALVFSSRTRKGGPVGPVRIVKTRRVGFRDLVRPDETIFVRVRVSPAAPPITSATSASSKG